MKKYWQKIAFLLPYISLLITESIILINGINYYLFSIFFILFFLSLTLLNKKKHKIIYLLYIPMIFKLAFFVPIIILIVAFINYDIYWRVSYKIITSLLLVILVIIVMGTLCITSIKLTNNLNKANHFIINAKSSQLINSDYICIKEPIKTTNVYHLKIQYELKGKNYYLTIPQTKRLNNEIYFYGVTKHFLSNSSSQIYNLKLLSNSHILVGTNVIFVIRFLYTSACIGGLSVQQNYIKNSLSTLEKANNLLLDLLSREQKNGRAYFLLSTNYFYQKKYDLLYEKLFKK